MNRWLIVSTLALFTIAGCGDKKPPTPVPSDKKTNSSGVKPHTTTDTRSADVESPPGSEKGLSQAQRDRYYHLDEGGEIIPLDWLRAMESAQTSLPFMEKLERFGFIADPNNSDGLPIGMTARESEDQHFIGKMVGINCAACHVGQITYKGKTIRIDGATNMLSFDFFLEDLGNSIKATLDSPSKVLAFLHRLSQQKESNSTIAATRPHAKSLLSEISDIDGLKKLGEMERGLGERIESLFQEEVERPALDLRKSYEAKGEETSSDRGSLKGLLEDVRHNVKDLLGKKFGDESPLAKSGSDDDRETTLVESLDQIRDTIALLKARIDLLVKINGQMTGEHKISMTPGGPGRGDDWAIIRNQVFPPENAIPAVQPLKFPQIWGFGDLKWLHYDGNTTSVMDRNTGQSLGTGSMFDPKTYASTVAERNLYELEVLSKKIVAPQWPDHILGPVDAAKAKKGAELYEGHCAKCHVAGPDSPLFSPDEVGTDPNRALVFGKPAGDVSFADALKVTAKNYREWAYEHEGITEEEAKKIEPEVPQWRTTLKYATRPLDSVWASPPYLHNGSVPTLYDLLQPVEKRPAKFWLGHREYDPVKLGYVVVTDRKDVSGTDHPIFEFDSTADGNKNTGHLYGTDLSEDDKWDLIEYLKKH